MPWDSDAWGVGGGGGGGEFNGVQVIYFGKHGNDANSGLDYTHAKLTIAGAIAAAIAGGVASNNEYALVCEDAGTYTENGLVLPQYCYLWAPNARLRGAGPLLDMSAQTGVRLGELNPLSGVGIRVNAGGQHFINIDRIQASGSADGIEVSSNSTTQIRAGYVYCYSSKALEVTAGAARVEFRCEFGTVVNAGTFVHQNGVNFGGRTSVNVDVLSLTQNAARGFLQDNGGDGLEVRAGTIQSYTGVTTASPFIVNSGTVAAVVGHADANGAAIAQVGGAATFNGVFGTRNGLVVGTGTRNVTDAGENYQPPRGVCGCHLEWASSSTLTVGTTGEQSSVRALQDTADIEFSGTLTGNMAVSGAGGLQSGSAEASSTWYEVHLIADSQGVNPVAVLFIPSGTGFSQAGYDLNRRIGWVRNNSSSNFRRFTQTGKGSRREYWVDENMVGSSEILTNGTATTWATISAAAAVPPGTRHFHLAYRYNPGSGADDWATRETGSTISRIFAPFSQQPAIAAPVNEVRTLVPCVCNTSQQFDYETQSGGPLDLMVAGYVDEL